MNASYLRHIYILMLHKLCTCFNHRQDVTEVDPVANCQSLIDKNFRERDHEIYLLRENDISITKNIFSYTKWKDTMIKCKES